jgi:hypothetical protein
MVKRVFKVLLSKKFEGAFINGVYKDGDILYMNLHLPEQKERADLEKILPNLQQEVGALAVRISRNKGKHFELQFGMRELETINIKHDDESIKPWLHEPSLKVTFPSSYGKATIDFEDGASCHMLNGGVTRMGKTCFLLYLSTILYLQNEGNVRLYVSSAKLKDYYPFFGLPNVKLTKSTNAMIDLLQELIDEYQKRDTLLYSPSLIKATDAKSVKKIYPEKAHLFAPIFLIIDEYARFAESKSVQEKVTELVETGGFVNVHVILASQRPDASTVLRPRIRANLLCRMAFTTADRKNSEVILDREGAEKLGKIAGRGILNDGDTQVIQVPYIDAVECNELLRPYYNEELINYEQAPEGCDDISITDQIQSLISESISMDDLFAEFKPNQRSQQSFEKDVFGWQDSTDTEGKR